MKLNTLEKVSDSFTIYRYDNGWMIEVSGRDEESDWKTRKILCNTEDELISIIKEYNNKKLDN
jgi:hypothetical protein